MLSRISILVLVVSCNNDKQNKKELFCENELELIGPENMKVLDI